MKKLLLIAAFGLSAVSMSAQALTVAQNFNVTATLASRCVTNNATPTDLAFGTYTAFGPLVTATPTTISFKCTRNGPAITAAVLTGGTGGTTGTIAGLDYVLVLGAVSAVPGTAPNPDVYNYTVTGTMAAGQAGDATAPSAAVAHTLTITY